MEIDDLVINCGETVIPGTTAKLHLVCACDVDVFPPYIAAPSTPAEKITLDGDITLVALKKFATLDIIVDSGEIEHNLVGVRGSKSYTNKYGFKIVKNAASDAWFDQNPNACVVGIVEQKDSTMRVFGNPKIPAFIDEANGKGGSNNESEAAWTASIMDSTGRVAPIYTGVIDLDPAT